MTFLPIWGAGSTLVEWEVLVAFATAPTSASPTYVDVTPRVVRASRARGRQGELERDEVATLELTLRNRDRALDPNYAAGPYYPNVKPTRRVRVNMRLAGGASVAWYDGYLGRWPQTWRGPKHSDVAVRAVDGFDPIGRAVFTASCPAERTDLRVARVLDAIGWPAARRQLFAGQSIMMAEDFDRAGALEVLRLCALTEQGRVFMSPAGDVVFQDRHRKILTAGTSAGIYGDSAPTEIPYRDITLTDDDEKIRNEIIGQRPGGVVQIAEDATSQNDHFLRSFTIEPHLQSDTEVADLVAYLLSQYKTARTRVEAMQLSATMDSRIPTRVLADDLGTRLTVRRRPLGLGAMVEQQVHVEKITDNIAQPDSGFEWNVDYELSPAEPQGFWVLGTSALGTDTRLAY